MRGVGRALACIVRNEPDQVIVLPAHRNPIVREALLPYLSGLENVLVTEPLPYGEFTRMLALARIVLTDSRGVPQEEAPSKENACSSCEKTLSDRKQSMRALSHWSLRTLEWLLFRFWEPERNSPELP